MPPLAVGLHHPHVRLLLKVAVEPPARLRPSNLVVWFRITECTRKMVVDVLGPKLLLAMGCVKLDEKICVHLPYVGEQTANKLPNFTQPMTSNNFGPSNVCMFNCMYLKMAPQCPL